MYLRLPSHTMKKMIAVAVFLVSSTAFVFARQSAVATAAQSVQDVPESMANINENDATTSDMLASQIQALEANISQIESANIEAASVLSQVVTAVSKPKPQVSPTVRITPVAMPTSTPIVTRVPTTTPAAIVVYGQSTYNSGNGVLLYANGTPVTAPDGARQSSNGYWYLGGQIYAIGPEIGIPYTPETNIVYEQAPIITPTIVASVTPSPAPVLVSTSTSRSRTRHEERDDD